MLARPALRQSYGAPCGRFALVARAVPKIPHYSRCSATRSGGGRGPTPRNTASSARRPGSSGGGVGGGGGSSSASILERALNYDVQGCRSLDELEAVLSCHASELSSVNVATAWLRLAKLSPIVARRGQLPPVPPQVDAVVRLLIGRTMATVHYMGLREVANCLWSMRKLSVRLQAQPNGHYLAELIEGRLLEVADAGDLANGRHAEQIWYCFAAPQKLYGYPWSSSLVPYLVAASLRHVQDWESRTVAQICLHWGRAGIQLTAEQRETLLRAAVVAVAQQEEEGMQQFINLDHWLTGCALLGLELPMATIKVLHDRLLATPEPFLREAMGMVEYSTALKRVLDLGYQPSAVQAELWRARLLGPLLPDGGAARISMQELTSGLLALSHISVLVPDEHMVEAFRGCLQAVRQCSREDARRLLAVGRQWSLLERTDAEYGRIKRLADGPGF